MCMHVAVKCGIECIRLLQFPPSSRPLPGRLQNVEVCTYKYVSHQSQFDGEEQQDVDFSADVKLSCQSGEQAAQAASRRSMQCGVQCVVFGSCLPASPSLPPHPTLAPSCHCSGHIWLPVRHSLLHPAAQCAAQLRHTPDQQQVCSDTSHNITEMHQ